ncbi:MAG TPA: hypothetical protein VJ400_05440 [Thermoplasmata archaeon]|nr:hypothetical protein [Thermoplasmata archaeon]
MGGTTVQVESKIIDGNPQVTKLETVSIRLPEMRMTGEDLIRRVVEEQVWDLLSRRKVDEAEARRILERQYLTQEQVDAQAQQGAVRAPRRTSRVPRIDVEAEVRKAVQAFADGTFLIVANGRQVSSLKEEVTFAESGKVTFLRLTPLVGG